MRHHRARPGAPASPFLDPGALDPGADLLLRKTPPPPIDGLVLDLACRDGAVACSLAAQAPAASVWAVDIAESARTGAARNVAAGDLANVVVAAPDDVPATLQFDAIYCNLPTSLDDAQLDAFVYHWIARLVHHEENPLTREFNRGNPVLRGGRAFFVLAKDRADALQRRLQREGVLTERLASGKGRRLLVVAGTVTAARGPNERGPE